MNHVRPSSRRKFLKTCAVGAGAGGAMALSDAVPQAVACMECLTEKLDGKYPIGKTTLVGDQVVPVGGHAGRGRAAAVRVGK